MDEYDEYFDEILADNDYVWEAFGPDAIDDWFNGGEERITDDLRAAIRDNWNEAEIGRIFISFAKPYLLDAAKTRRETSEEIKESLDSMLNIRPNEHERADNKDRIESLKWRF